MHRENDAAIERPGSRVQPSSASTPVLLALGSNLGDRRAHLESGLGFVGQHMELEAISRVVESEAWGPVAQGAFLNVVARGRFGGDVLALLDVVQAAEKHAGRIRAERYGPRTLDVDVILFGEEVVESALLTVPHPRWQERPFVSALVAEVAGDLEDPRSGRRIRDLFPEAPLPPELTEARPLEFRPRAGVDDDAKDERRSTAEDGR